MVELIIFFVCFVKNCREKGRKKEMSEWPINTSIFGQFQSVVILVYTYYPIAFICFSNRYCHTDTRQKCEE